MTETIKTQITPEQQRSLTAYVNDLEKQRDTNPELVSTALNVLFELGFEVGYCPSTEGVTLSVFDTEWNEPVTLAR